MVIGALLMCEFVLIAAFSITGRFSAVDRWVSRHGGRLYNAVVGDGISDAMFFDDERMRLSADDAKRLCAA